MVNRRLNFLLFGGCICLAVICCVLALTEGNEKPYIQSETGEYVYYNGMPEQEFLNDLQAYDEEDGDITDKILIQSKVMVQDGVKVTYIVWDSAHESGSYTRDYRIASDEEVAKLVSEGKKPAVGDEIQNQEGDYREISETEGEEPEETEPTNESESAGENTEGENSEAPVLVLTANHGEIEAGSNFNYWNYIQSIEDNKDDLDYLSTQIVLSGEYDTTVPGIYELLFWVLDSDGNSSEQLKFTLTVK